MNKKKAEILFLLLKCSDTMTLSDLWAFSSYESSIRTIRSDINHINDFLREHKLAELAIHRDGKVEFTGDEPQRQQALHVLLNQMDYYKYRLGSQERARVLTCHMIQASGYVNHKELCSVVYVSRGTLYADMQQCAKIAAEYGLTLSSRPSKGYIMEGSEWDKRQALYKLQKRWSEKDESTYSDYKPILSQLEDQEKIVFSDRGYLETLRHIDISLDRIRNGYILDAIPEAHRHISVSTCDNAVFVWAHLTEKFQLTPTEEEIIALEIRLRMCGRIDGRPSCISDGVMEAANEFIESISPPGQLLKCPAESKNNLCMFLDTLFYGVNEEYSANPLIEKTVFSEYPEVNRAVEDARQALEKRLGRKLSPEEFYQLLLFAVSILESASRETLIPRALLVCDGGPGEADLLSSQVKRLFPVDIIDVTAEHAAGRSGYKHAADLIITTVAPGSADVPVIHVSPILTLVEIRKIQECLLECLYGSRFSSEKDLQQI